MTIFLQHIFKTEPDYRCIEYRTLGSRSIEVVTWPKGGRGRGRLIVACERQTFSSLIAPEGRFPPRETSLSGDERGETSAVRRLA